MEGTKKLIEHLESKKRLHLNTLRQSSYRIGDGSNYILDESLNLNVNVLDSLDATNRNNISTANVITNNTSESTKNVRTMPPK